MKTVLSFNDILMIPQYSTVGSRSEVDLSTQISPTINLDIPLISVNMDTVTGVKMVEALNEMGGISFYPRFDTIENIEKDIKSLHANGKRVIASLGIKDGYLERAERLIKAGATGITIDVAHAHTERTVTVVEDLKKKFPEVPLIVGTIATYYGALDLFNAGADAVRVGVGAGTICTTRIVAGHGIPQVTAISEAVRARNECYPDRFIIADGGMVNSGDIVKALALGANAVCLGSLFAGTDEAPGQIVSIEDKLYKEYNGSTSKTEKTNQVGKDKSQKDKFYTLHVEGVEGLVKYKGSVKHVIEELCAGLRSGFSYSGAHDINELWENAEFVQITNAGLQESRAHDIILSN